MAQTNANRNSQQHASSSNKSNINQASPVQNTDSKKNKAVKGAHYAEPSVEDKESDNIGNKKLSTEKSDKTDSQSRSGNHH